MPYIWVVFKRKMCCVKNNWTINKARNRDTCIMSFYTTFSFNIFIYFSEHIQTQNRKFGTMNNIMKKKRMGKQVQNTYTNSSP